MNTPNKYIAQFSIYLFTNPFLLPQWSGCQKFIIYVKILPRQKHILYMLESADVSNNCMGCRKISYNLSC